MSYVCGHCDKSFDTKRGLGTHKAQYCKAEWNDRDWLYERYVEKEQSTIKMAEIAGCCDETIRKALKKHGIETRSMSESQRIRRMGDHPCFYTSEDGYEIVVNCHRGERYNLSLHRLLAVSEYGFDAVKGMEVHHINEVKWDNRPDNIELMTSSEHRAHHHSKVTKEKCLEFQRRYGNETSVEIAEDSDFSISCILTHAKNKCFHHR